MEIFNISIKNTNKPDRNSGTILAIGFGVSLVIHLGAMAGIMHSWQPHSDRDDALEITLIDSVPIEPIASVTIPKPLPPKSKPIAPNPTIKPVRIAVKPLQKPIFKLPTPKISILPKPLKSRAAPVFANSLIPVAESPSSPLVKSNTLVKKHRTQTKNTPSKTRVLPQITATPFPTLGNLASTAKRVVKSQPITRKSNSKSSPLNRSRSLSFGNKRSASIPQSIVNQPINPTSVSTQIETKSKPSPPILPTPIDQYSPLPIDPNSTNPAELLKHPSSSPITRNSNNLNPQPQQITTDLLANFRSGDRQNKIGSDLIAGVNSSTDSSDNGGKDSNGGNHNLGQNNSNTIGNYSGSTGGTNSVNISGDRQAANFHSGGGLQCIKNCQLPKLKDLQAADAGKDRIRIRIEVNPNGTIVSVSIATSSGNPQIDAIVLAGVQKMQLNPPGKMIKGIVRINIFL